MAELVGVIASVVTIINVVSTLSGLMMDLAKLSPAAGEEIEDFATDLCAFYMAVDLSLNCIHRYMKAPALEQSPVLRNLLKTGGFELLKQKSRQIKRRVQKAWKVAKSVESKFSFFKDKWTAINWLIRKPELLSLRPELEAFKTTIILIITALALEMKLDSLTELENVRGSIPENIFEEKLAEIEDLKAQIRVQVKMIAFSQEREERRRQRLTNSPGTLEERLERRETLQVIIMDIGTSLAEHGRVTNLERLSRSSSTTEYSSRRPSDIETNASTPLSTPLSASPRSEHRMQQSSTRNRLSSPGPPIEISPHGRTSKGKIAHRRDHGTQAQRRNQLPGIHPLRHKQQPIVANLEQIPSRLAESSMSGQDEVISSQPTQSFDEPQISVESQGFRVSGYINTPDGLVPAKVQVTKEFPAHAISAKYADILGLVVEPHGNGSVDGTRKLANFYSRGEEVVSIGKVTFQWRGASTTPPFNVTCRVFPDQPVNLVFGKDFLERRSFYASGSEDKDGGEWMR
ncbi:hypothetical protein BKA65DRAFT_129941 [Rhexocercosporidium sp. MPI-PUGE-AT-0058]|nr:hypothetical protein BKA65DRAFT_129941 [Rhexocercosporidium sp. MPI-PUGE-AT-0058]